MSQNVEQEIEENVSTSCLCEICGVVFEKTSNLEHHMKSQHIEPGINKANKFTCKKCDLSFNSEHELNYHCEQNHDEKEMECDVCGKYT